MVLDSGKKRYRVLRELYNGRANEVVICRDLQDAGTAGKAVWLIRDRRLARKLIEIFALGKEAAYEECFWFMQKACFVFPYGPERPLETFYPVARMSGPGSGPQIWMRIVMLCMTCGLPESILYLLLRQRQLQISTDGQVSFQYCLDLSGFDENRRSEDCVEECARLLRELMDGETGYQTTGELIEKKLRRKGYPEFTALYRDIRLTVQRPKQNEKKASAGWWRANQDKIYRILRDICAVLLVTVAILLFFRLVFGDALLYQLIRGAPDKIGTESLLQ